MVDVFVICHGDYEDHGALAIVATEEEAIAICSGNNVGLDYHHKDMLYWSKFTVGDLVGLGK